MTKLYEHNGKTYEVMTEDGLEVINSDEQPGPDWIEVTPEKRDALLSIKQSAIERKAIIEKLKLFNNQLASMIAQHNENQ